MVIDFFLFFFQRVGLYSQLEKHSKFYPARHCALSTDSIIENQNQLSTIEACAYLCMKHQSCVAFSYRHETGICVLSADQPVLDEQAVRKAPVFAMLFTDCCQAGEYQ